MADYNAEAEQGRIRLRQSLPGIEFRLRLPGHLFNRLRNRARRFWNRLGRDRALFFPMDFPQMPPPPGEAPAFIPRAPRSPVDGTPPTHLLFSSRDTRFGDPLISYLYYHQEQHLVSVYPPLDRDQLKSLYARNYNRANPEIIPHQGTSGSPYRNFRARSPLLRFAMRVRLPSKIRAAAARAGLLNWPDMSLEEINSSVRRLLPASLDRPRFLDVGCFEGKLLDRFTELGTWRTCGIEPNEQAAATARAKGHQVWTAEVEDILKVMPPDQHFDVIFLGQAIEHFGQPLAALVHLSMLLEPHGLLVLSTPNLESAQIEMFGPTWAHWHVPYHRHIFSPEGIARLAAGAGLRMLRCHTFSHPSWSWLSQKLHTIGLGGAVPHGYHIPPEDIQAAESLAVVSRLLYDWRGRGDYLYAVFAKDLRG
jgi:SAM-dependent methyltransferase